MPNIKYEPPGARQRVVAVRRIIAADDRDDKGASNGDRVRSFVAEIQRKVDVVDADQRIVAEATEDRVIAPSDHGRVVAFVGEHEIGLRAARCPDRIIAETGDQGIVTADFVDRVVSTIAEYQVAHAAGQDGLGPVGRVVAAADGQPDVCVDDLERIGSGAAEQYDCVEHAVVEDVVVPVATIDQAGIAVG